MAANKTTTRAPGSKRVAGFIGALILVPGIAAASLTAGYSTASAAPVTINPTLSSLAAPYRANAPCPPSMAHVGTSCVDKFEASLVERTPDGEVAFSPYQAPNGHDVRAVSRRGVVPQAHISMVEAKRACAASGKRLCKAQEWKTACKGPDSTRYPYGNKREAGACVDTNRTSPMGLLHNGEHSAKTLNDPLANQQANTLEATGSHESCSNGYDVHDMVGNVHEWTDDASFRGGYYLDTKLNGEGCDYRTTAHAPSYYDYSTGFRCCADEGSIPADDGI
ncbi:MAG: Protein kinase domain protein [Labilithrix sp.]|nr:Protein kinase domain protein [Labilithrix sp.]